MLSTDMSEAGAIIRKRLPLNPGAAYFYGNPKRYKATEPINISVSLFPVLAPLAAG